MEAMFSRPPTTLSEMGVIGSTLAGYAFLWATFSRFISLIPLYSLFCHLRAKLFPEVCVTIPHQPAHGHASNELYFAVESYLRSAATERADNLKATMTKDGQAIALSLDKGERVADNFQGVPLLWTHCSKQVDQQRGGHEKRLGGSSSDGQEKRWYSLKFLRRYRSLVLDSYLQHILNHSREMEGKARKRKLYNNCIFSGPGWNNMSFEHPATFETLAMEPAKKKRIMDDLETFSQSKDYYVKIGKAWKRGYLLYGPPGTGKSTLVAAMANFLRYDVYDLDLSAVRNNSELRKLLASTGSKSILVVEDIDCSLQLAASRRAPAAASRSKNMNSSFIENIDDEEDEDLTNSKSPSKLTLSGMLNLIDGLWSVSHGERIIVFTTNHVSKLDPALIRRGRMDVHIDMSFCNYEGFKILAKNYLGIDQHPMFEQIRELIGEVSITPADVAERLMPKTLEASAPEKASACLGDLIDTMTEMKRR